MPLAAQYSCCGDGRKGAYQRRDAMAPAPPLPRHHDEHSGQDEEWGRSRLELGKWTDKKSAPSACPTQEASMVFHG